MKSKLNKKLKSKIEQLVHLFWVWITRVNQKSAPLTGTPLTGTPLTDTPLREATITHKLSRCQM